MISGLLRIALALIVVVHHLSRFGIGKTCVYVFFALSGYWVARMWTDKYRKLPHPWRSFVLARFLRIWPLFVLCNIAGMFMFDWIGRPLPPPCENATLSCLQSLVGNGLLLGYGSMADRALGPAWSLDIELQFYLIAPALILMLRGRPLVWMLTATTVAAAALLAATQFPETLPQYLPFFALGILAATQKLSFGRRAAIASAAATLGVLLSTLLTDTGRGIVMTGSAPTALVQYNEALNVLLGLLATPGALYLATRERQVKGAALGDIAFAIYIVHWIPVTLVNNYWGSLPAGQRLPYVAGALLATIAAALLVWKLIDQPLERWRRGLLSAPRGTIPGRVPARRTGHRDTERRRFETTR